jgi:hypothetical protein
MAGHQAARAGRPQQRDLGTAPLDGQRAAGVEDASWGRIGRVGRFAGQDDPGSPGGPVDLRHRGAQRLGVGVGGRLQQLPGRAALHDPAQVQHGGLLAQLAHDREVVRDEQIGQLPFGAQPRDQAEHARLRPHVQGAGRLVQHQQPRLHAERAGDRDALALPAGQLMRVPGREVPVQAHLGQQVPGSPGRLPARHHTVGAQRLLDGGTDPHPGIEAVVGVLEHDLRRATVVLQRPAAQGGEVSALEPDLAPADPGQPDHGPADRGLARPALPDQAEAERPGGKLQADPVDRPDRPETHRQVPDLEDQGLQRRTHPAAPFRAGPFPAGPFPAGPWPAGPWPGGPFPAAVIRGTAASRSAV